MPDELGELFPELIDVLNQFDQPSNLMGDPETGGPPPEHSGITDEQIEQAIRNMGRVGPPPVLPGQSNGNGNQFQSGTSAPPPPPAYVEGDQNGNGNGHQAATSPSPEAAPSASDGTPVSPVPGAAPEPSQPPSADELVNLGVDEDNNPIIVPRSRLLAYRGFEQELEADPRLQQFLAHYLTTGELPSGAVGGVEPASVQPPSAVSPPPSSPEQLPPEILDDPALAAIWNAQQRQIAELTSQVQSLSGGLTTTIQQQQQRAQAENNAIINRAVSSFKDQHGLSDEEMMNLRQVAANLNVLPSLMSGIDPITNAPTRPDPLAAVERSLEIAMYSMPEYRQRDFIRTVKQRVEDNQRKKKLGALSGNSGSTPRTNPAPTTQEGRREAMVRELTAMQAGEWNGDE